MIRFVIRKIIHNKWLVTCLLIGVVLAVSMVSSIPMFADGILNRVLTKDLEEYQSQSRVYTGRYYMKCNLDTSYKEESRLNSLNYFDARIPEMIDELRLPIIGEMTLYSINAFRTSKSAYDESRGVRYAFKVAAAESFFDKVDIIYGIMPSDTVSEGGVIEVVMSNSNMIKNDWVLNKVYEVYDGQGRFEGDLPLYFKIVGVFEVTDPSDPSWYSTDSQVTSQMMMNYDLFRRLFIGSSTTFISTAEYYYAIDYHNLRISNLDHVYKTLLEQESWLLSRRSFEIKIPLLALVSEYTTREAQLRTMLLVIQIPILLMLAFYTFMISQLILDYERNEISVLKSRGASRWQIVLIYFIESTLIGLAALILGILTGVGVCRMIGASNGFLEFISRTALYIELTPTVIIYALITVLFSILTMVLPAIGYSKIGIVEHKKSLTGKKTPLWQKLGLDAVLLGVSWYGLYAYKMRSLTLAISGMDANSIPIDPLLFIMSTLFIIGAGLLFVRIFPYIIRLVFFIGKKVWSPVMYASFLQVGRSGGQEAFLMLFLVMTLSLGLFSANAARTLNTNVTDKVQYALGADIVITPFWRSVTTTIVTEPEEGSMSINLTPTRGFANEHVTTYFEPDFSPYYNLEGVDSVAKVLRNESITVSIGTKNTSGNVMAINPADFGRTAFMPEELLQAHWFNYLNLLTMEKKACLISSLLAEEYKLSVGDTIKVSWNKQTPIELRIYGIVEYWPAFKPLGTARSPYSPSTRLVVCNLDYIQAFTLAEPYQVWLSRAEGATSEEVYQSIVDLGIAVEKLENSAASIISAKNDPLLQGVNGAMTMGFIVTMIVCAIGFLIYWILSIKRRVLQFGILRAMGLSMSNVIAMLISEQVMISGSAILVGMFTGAKASELFVPLLQIVYSAEELIPPFRIIMLRGDYIKVYIIIGAMLLVAFAVLAVLISRIKMAQALKLGED